MYVIPYWRFSFCTVWSYFLDVCIWFYWLLNSFPLHLLFYIALSSPWLGKRGLVYMLLSISELVHLYAPTFVWLYAKGNIWFMTFTLHHHHSSFITDNTHIWYTNLVIYKNKEARLVPKSNVWICPWNMQSNKLHLFACNTNTSQTLAWAATIKANWQSHRSHLKLWSNSNTHFFSISWHKNILYT